MSLQDGLIWHRMCMQMGVGSELPQVASCEICERVILDTEGYYCDCAKVVCVDCFVVCTRCETGNCPDCLEACLVCEMEGCKDCLTLCEKCGYYLCPEHAESHSEICDGEGIPPLI